MKNYIKPEILVESLVAAEAIAEAGKEASVNIEDILMGE